MNRDVQQVIVSTHLSRFHFRQPRSRVFDD